MTIISKRFHYQIVVQVLENKQYDTKDLVASVIYFSDILLDHMIESKEML